MAKNLPTGVTIPAGGSSVPLSRTVYVDKTTSVDPGDQNGSIAAPFSTATAGLAALAAIEAIDQQGNYTLMLCPAIYDEELIWNPVESIGSRLIIANASLGWSGYNLIDSQPLIDSIDNQGQGTLAMYGIIVGADSATDGVQSNGAILAQGCQFWFKCGTAFEVDYYDCSFVLGPSGVFGCGGGKIVGGQVSAGLLGCAGSTLDIYSCKLQPDLITFASPGGTLRLDGSSEFWYNIAAPVLTNATVTQMVG